MLAGTILERFLHEDGSFAMTADQRELLMPVTDEGDSEMPSGTSAAIDLLLQLAAASSAEPRFARAATRAVNRLSGTLQDFPSLWATTVVALNVHTVPGQKQTRVTVPAGPPAKAQGDFRIPVTADHVRVSAVKESTANADHVVVTVMVDEGYHINANPASFDFLIPTSVRFSELTPAKIAYPQPVGFKTAFAEQELEVYEGAVRLTASFPKDGLLRRGTIRGVVTAQACDERVCLPPSDLPFTVNVASQ